MIDNDLDNNDNQSQQPWHDWGDDIEHYACDCGALCASDCYCHDTLDDYHLDD